MDATETPAVPSSTTPAAPLSTSTGGYQVHIGQSVITVIAVSAAFGLITKYGLKKSNGWVACAAIAGVLVGGITDGFIQAKMYTPK